MSIRDFLILLMKVFGLFWLIRTFFEVIALVGRFGDPGMLTVTLVITAIFVLLFYYLVYKADWVVDYFNLAKGFTTNHIAFEKIQPDTVMSLGCIITGGLMVVLNFGECLVYLYVWIKGRASAASSYWDLNNSELGLTFMINLGKVLVGYLLLTNHAFIAQKLAPKNTNAE